MQNAKKSVSSNVIMRKTHLNFKIKTFLNPTKILGKSRSVNSKGEQDHPWKMENMQFPTQSRAQDKNVTKYKLVSTTQLEF